MAMGEPADLNKDDQSEMPQLRFRDEANLSDRIDLRRTLAIKHDLDTYFCIAEGTL